MNKIDRSAKSVKVILLATIFSIAVVLTTDFGLTQIINRFIDSAQLLSEYAIYNNTDDTSGGQDDDKSDQSDYEEQTTPGDEFNRYSSYSEEDKLLYDQIYEALTEFKPMVCKFDPSKGADDLANRISDITIYGVLVDNPQIFWTGGGFTYTYYDDADDSSMTIDFEFFIDKKTAENYSQSIREKVNSIVEEVNSKGFTSDYEKALYCYEWLCNNIEYNFDIAYGTKQVKDEDIIRRCYGAFIKGNTVCEGYAKAFQMLMYKLNIPCTTVLGTYENIGHAWNVAKIDGVNTHIDATWGDQVTFISYQYFGQTEAEVRDEGKKPMEASYWPECVSKEASYAEHNGGVTLSNYPNIYKLIAEVGYEQYIESVSKK